jgi:hypothetical protein
MNHSNVIAEHTNVSDMPSFATVNSAFPSIGHKIELFWGYPEFTTLMFDLQQDMGDRPRLGFPVDVMLALQNLESEHDHEFPNLQRKVQSFWQML